MNDLLLHGLREILNHDVIDYPGAWYLYKDEAKNRDLNCNKLWGKGFTASNILDDYNKIERDDILTKIKKRYFNLIIYGSIRRSNLYIEEAIKNGNKCIFIDGEDDQNIDKRYLGKGLYFKRELFKNTTNILPISLAVPRDKIINEISKTYNHLLAPLIPGKLKTYIYNDEISYYEMYKKSIFALTNKKKGWDCLRHYEILMNGAIPLFLDLENCPKLTLNTLPKKKLLFYFEKYEKILSFYNPLKIYKKNYLTFKLIKNFIKNFRSDKSTQNYLSKNSEVLEIKSELLDFTRNNLTTSHLGKYIIEKASI